MTAVIYIPFFAFGYRNGFSSEYRLAFPHVVFFAGGNWVKFLSGFLQGSALGGYHRHEFVPGFYERSGAFVLEFRGQSVAIDSGLGELRQNRFAIPPIGRYRRTEFAVIGKGFQGTLWHGINRKWCGQFLDVKYVRGLGIFGSRTGKQKSLWAGASVEASPLARRRY